MLVFYFGGAAVFTGKLRHAEHRIQNSRQKHNMPQFANFEDESRLPYEDFEEFKNSFGGRRNLKSSFDVYDMVKNSIDHGVEKIKKEAKILKKLAKKTVKDLKHKIHSGDK